MNPEDVARFEQAFELGKEIAADLDQQDVLGRWMAYHISDLITRVEVAPAGKVDVMRGEVFNTILALWRNRTALPTAPHAPLAAFEPVFKALERLSEPDEPWGYYRAFPSGYDPSADDVAVAPLLQAALRLEDGARRGVRELVALAAQIAADTDAKWLKLSEGIEGDEQREALDAIQELAWLLEANTDDVGSEPLADPKVSRLIATLQGVEAELAATRKILEARLIRTSLDGGPGEPE
nr:hypothetical protein [Streptomyces sp. S10(2018)]